MIYLLLTIITSVLIIISFKVFHILKINPFQAITFNYFFGFIYGILFCEREFTINAIVESQWFWPAIAIGFVFIAGFFLFSRSTKKAGVSITAISAKMSVVIPVVAGFIIFGDSITYIKVLGIVLAMLSFYLVFKTEKNKAIDVKYILLPMLLFLVSGLNDLLIKYVQHHYLSGEILMFLSIVFFSAFVLGVIYLVLSKAKENRKVLFSAIFGGFVLGSFNYLNAWAFIKSMEIFESSVLFPIVNVSVVSIAALSGVMVFGEKLKTINQIGIILSILAILLISLANGN